MTFRVTLVHTTFVPPRKLKSETFAAYCGYFAFFFFFDEQLGQTRVTQDMYYACWEPATRSNQPERKFMKYSPTQRERGI